MLLPAELTACSYISLHNGAAQGSVEYVIVFAALSTIFFTLAALLDLFAGGEFISQAILSASHNLGGHGIGGICDVLLF